MKKLFICTALVFTSLIGAGAYATSIHITDDKDGPSDINTKSSIYLTGGITSRGYKPFLYLYTDGKYITLIGSAVECHYKIRLYENGGIVVLNNSTPWYQCTYGVVRTMTPHYQAGYPYATNDVVHFLNEDNTESIYKCFNGSLCRQKGYKPGQESGDKVAWVQLSRGYYTPFFPKGSVSIGFKDYKHAPYFENDDTNLPLSTTLKAKTEYGSIDLYVDNVHVSLPQKNKSGGDCNYTTTLYEDNAILVNSDNCFSGYVREPSYPYRPGISYQKGDVVIVKNQPTQRYDYYQCVVASLCRQAGPTEPYGTSAWCRIFSNKFAKYPLSHDLSST